ncbi:unnamed protein product [Cyprideis torosa]|uniref:Uncharacterized protein n=1 Tax=Cyprideis torosa TaxID=163714 RepID=A0A7R9A0J9_9CRUS|nr:unnamed protein product [Cyprideis torosa]CAG0911062.1 unnamed protein product [Cyprideis torosa]
MRYPGLRRFVLLPLLVNLVIFGGGTWWGFSGLESYLDQALPGWLSWAQFILLPLFTITALIMMFYTFTLVANLIASPFNSLLAEKIERRLAGEIPSPASSVLQVAKEAAGAVGSEVRKLLYMAGWAIPLMILFLIPGLNLLAPLLWGLFGAWMLAFTYLDYPMGNHGLTFRDEKLRLRQHRGLAMGFGSAMLVMTFIPVLNFFAMPAGVAGATLLWVERIKSTG